MEYDDEYGYDDDQWMNDTQNKKPNLPFAYPISHIIPNIVK